MSSLDKKEKKEKIKMKGIVKTLGMMILKKKKIRKRKKKKKKMNFYIQLKY